MGKSRPRGAGEKTRRPRFPGYRFNRCHEPRRARQGPSRPSPTRPPARQYQSSARSRSTASASISRSRACRTNAPVPVPWRRQHGQEMSRVRRLAVRWDRGNEVQAPPQDDRRLAQPRSVIDLRCWQSAEAGLQQPPFAMCRRCPDAFTLEPGSEVEQVVLGARSSPGRRPRFPAPRVGKGRLPR